LEEELIKRARAGDTQAFRLLVEEYAELTGRLAETFLGSRRADSRANSSAAEDALQEAWFDAWRNLGRFQPGKPFRPWICKLVVNRCRMALRRGHFKLVPLDGLDLYALPAVEDATGPVLEAETRVELRAALAELSPENRQILELRFFVGLEVNEIAAIAGLPAGTVKSKLHRSLEKLRRFLSEKKQMVRE
jgi:RNA polymerase sigma-70 factor (ECF subfamily)